MPNRLKWKKKKKKRLSSNDDWVLRSSPWGPQIFTRFYSFSTHTVSYLFQFPFNKSVFLLKIAWFGFLPPLSRRGLSDTCFLQHAFYIISTQGVVQRSAASASIERLRNADFQAPSQTYWVCGDGVRESDFNKLFRGFLHILKFQKLTLHFSSALFYYYYFLPSLKYWL